MQKKKTMDEKRPDYFLILNIFALILIGIIMVFSASPTMGLKAGDPYLYFKRHIFYVVLGIIAFNFALRTNFEKLKKNAPIILIISLLLLLLPFVPGFGLRISGAKRWIHIASFSFQPSEFTKLALIIFLSTTLPKIKKILPYFFVGVLPILGLFGFIFAVLLKQPDLGTALVVSSITFSLLFIAGMQIKHLLGLLICGILGVGVLSFTSTYRLRRIMAFIDPWKDPLNVGFHIIQSLLAVGSGGLFGLGLGNSRQKLFYLPQQYTDFIFAILCEEMGYIGGAVVIFLFAIFVIRSLRLAKFIQDDFSRLMVVGITTWVGMQAFMNMAVVTSLIPTTGIPLPFISYGGTSFVITLYACGLLIKASRHGRLSTKDAKIT